MVHVGLANAHRDTERSHHHYKSRKEQEFKDSTKIPRNLSIKTHRITSLLAAMLAPMVILLGLPGLTENWYVRLNPEDGTIFKTQKDPIILTTALAISFILSVFGTLSFLGRLVDKNMRLWTLTAIGFYSVHIILCTISLVVFALKAAKPKHYEFSTAFYLTTSSTILAFLVILLLFLDGIVTGGYRKLGSGVSPKQKSMILGFMIFLGVIMIGTVSFKYLIGLDFLDSIYFVIQSSITTGFGDIVPTNTASRIFAILYNTFGILSFAIFVAFIRATALESMESTYKEREKILLSRVRTNGFRRTVFGKWNLKERIKKVFWGIEEEVEEETNNPEVNAEDRASDCMTEKDYEEAVVELKNERSREFRSQIFVSSTLFLIVWLVGSGVFMKLEGWSFFISFYFCFISFSSIGYGDFYPKTPAGRAFFCVWSLVGAGSLTVLFSVLSEAYSSRFKETFRHNWLASMAAKLPFTSTTSTQDDIKNSELEVNNFTNNIAATTSSQEKRNSKTLNEVATRSPPPNYTLPESDVIERKKSNVKNGGKESKGDDTLGETLLDLIEDVKEHVSQLIHSDGAYGSTPAVDRAVKKVMDEQNFSVRNRELVNSDEDLKRYLYLRRLDEKLTKLKKTAEKALAEEAETQSKVSQSDSTSRSKHDASRDAKDQIQADRDEINEDS